MSNNNTTTDEQAMSSLPIRKKGLRWSVNVSHTVVLVLSLALIVYISYDTFQGIPFLENHHYMTFQFWVCIIFMLDFFLELIASPDKKYYLKARWLFFFISIPFLNIINLCHIELSDRMMFYIRFIPLLRGAYSLALVMGYVSSNRAVSLMTQYTTILLAFIYSLSLVFFYEEHNVNPNVKEFWDALYWAAMNTNTVGCYFSAVTPVGKVISVVLPLAGMIMLPLFTVVITTKVQAFDTARQKLYSMFDRENKKDKQQPETPAPTTAGNNTSN